MAHLLIGTTVHYLLLSNCWRVEGEIKKKGIFFLKAPNAAGIMLRWLKMADKEPKQRSELLFTVLAIVLFAVSGVFVYRTFFIPSFEDVQRARMKISELQQEIRRFKAENEKLRATIQALQQNDPAAWEDATRKYLGWVKPGEILIESGRR
jgi:cell division protein FtsB